MSMNKRKKMHLTGTAYNMHMEADVSLVIPVIPGNRPLTGTC